MFGGAGSDGRRQGGCGRLASLFWHQCYGQQRGGSSAGGGGSGGAVDCSAFHDDEPGSQVTFTVTNHRATPIYYYAAECFERFRVGPEGGDLGKADLPSAEMTCEEAQTADDWPLDCHGDTAIEIAAGQSATFHWTGLLYEPREMPVACAAQPENPLAANCPRAVAVQPGGFEFSLQLFGAVTCEEGPCSSPIDPFTVEQGFTYPGDTAVAIAVD
ncbi:uncharacterized protein SOCE26_084000 [Sorangium cellulosum]|uniref:Uncharacterized protein n=1 Tax=Sorangium cellulosum TaxID=56 RepID=A0A2L0F5W4_SORCE|nr:hypothetical protein [Sorangium cellulosum]AUX46891.1 uncharacterized protein SOCE26_084000 [Sorangium cellulosum]